MKNTTTAETKRTTYIAKNYSLTQRDGLWVGRSHGSEIVSESKGRVIFEARRQWGHFNYQDEADAFGAIFPARESL